MFKTKISLTFIAYKKHSKPRIQNFLKNTYNLKHGKHKHLHDYMIMVHELFRQFITNFEDKNRTSNKSAGFITYGCYDKTANCTSGFCDSPTLGRFLKLSNVFHCYNVW